jgi:hypothetical protein
MRQNQKTYSCKHTGRGTRPKSPFAIGVVSPLLPRQMPYSRFVDGGRRRLHRFLSAPAGLTTGVTAHRVRSAASAAFSYVPRRTPLGSLQTCRDRTSFLQEGEPSLPFNHDSFLRSLDRFYRAIEDAAHGLDDFTEKQHFLNTVYERFFQGYSVKVADTHGIVYTPQAIVDFMCAIVAEMLQTTVFKGTLNGV